VRPRFGHIEPSIEIVSEILSECGVAVSAAFSAVSPALLAKDRLLGPYLLQHPGTAWKAALATGSVLRCRPRLPGGPDGGPHVHPHGPSGL